jgi:hypothetical protein
MVSHNLRTIFDNIHDEAWRLQNLYRITTKEKEEKIFTMNPIQKDIDRSKDRFKAILKSRQVGISTYFLIKKLDKTLWTPNQTTCILAHEDDAIKKLFRIIRYAYDGLPDAIRPNIWKGGGSMYEMFFPGINSRIYCDLESRGDTISNLHVSEYAFVRDADRVRATMDAVPLRTGEISIETTPNGMNHFYDEWNSQAWPFKKFFYPWYLEKGYALDVPAKDFTNEEIDLIEFAWRNYKVALTAEQIAFRRFKIAQKGKKHFIQEFPEDDATCFLMSGNPAFDLEVIKKIQARPNKPISEKDGIRIWNEFEKHERYVIGCDVAEGVGKDYSVAVVYKISTREQVAQLRGHFKPGDFAHKINFLASKFKDATSNWPLVAVERNNHGHAVLLELSDHIFYPNLFKDSDDRYGWKTDRISRPVMVDTFIEAVEKERLKIKDFDLISECLTLVDNNGKIEAQDKKHDDCVIAGAIGLQMVINSGANFTDNMLTF